MLKTTRSRVVAGLTVGVIAVTGALATAAWLANGTGSGSAKATSSKTLVLSDASASVSADLYPGASGDLVLKIENPNGFPVQLTSITQDGDITSSAGTSCKAASTGLTYTAPASLADKAFNIAAGQTKTITLDDALAMSNASDDSCQGATFTVPVKVAAQSAA
jgi:hypothetical protein